MAAIIPILKAVLPHVAKIATAAIPAFTSRTDPAKVDPVVAQQIGELQQAATHNAESIQVLADKLQQSIASIDEGANRMQQEIEQLRRWLMISVFIGSLALVTSLVLIIL